MRSFREFHPAHREQGVALIITLSFIVLLTVVVVAYFSRSMSERRLSDSSANQTKVEVFAKSAADVIVSDLKQEIVNGSTPLAVGTSPNQSYVYLPLNAADMQPMRSGNPAFTAGTTDPIPNLIRRSVRDNGSTGTNPMPTPGLPSRASAVNSAIDVSANGRSVSPARWNQHGFIPRVPGATDSTPVGTFAAPDWVLVTNTTGPTVLTTATLPVAATSVVGRYAYAIYDEGGLLDMNVAGYPGTDSGSPSSTGLTPAQIAQKGALALADLTQLPNSVITQQQVNQIVGWRNYATGQPSGSYSPASPASGFAFTATSASAWLIRFVTANTTGFLSTVYGTWNNRTDQRFLSRQQLIAMQTSLGISPDALQYLGTFSRELNAPTFSYPIYTPSYAAPNPIGYSNTQLVYPNYSRILALRRAQGGTANDGFTWNAGDPLLCRRFPLGRLALVAYNATNTSTTSDIYKYFGLYRTEPTDATDASKAAWIYTGSNGATTAAAAIETLAQVAAETPSREPNFFELLKAAIHQDSLGVKTGFPATAGYNGWVGNGDLVDGLTDLQILRIGANIIDQADADSYPTVIQYFPSTLPVPLYAYGIEDLPYINAVGFRCIDPNWTAPNYCDPSLYTNRKLSDQIVPVLWNPHRTVNQPSGSGIPSDIQFYFVGATQYTLNNATTQQSIYGTGGSATLSYNEMGMSGFKYAPANGQNTGYIDIPSSQFASTASGGLAAFASPSLIYTNLASTAVPIAGSCAYAPLPFHTNKIFGLTLGNPVYAVPRAPVSSEVPPSGGGTWTNPAATFTGWDGYFTITSAVPKPEHHLVNPGPQYVGLNAVLRYKDYQGNWQVYSAFASNETNANGAVNTKYDTLGLTNPSNTNGDQISTFITPTGFPCTLSQTMTDISWQNPSTTGNNNAGTPPPITTASANDAYFVMKGDPRTARFGVAASFHSAYLDDPIWHLHTDPYVTLSTFGYAPGNWVPAPASNSSPPDYIVTTALTAQGGHNGNPGLYYPAMWAQNVQANGLGTYYFDNGTGGTGLPSGAGIVRPGDDYFTSVSGLPNTSPNSDSSNYNMYALPDAQPVVLNRPFQSVGELGYAYRDMPYKSLDMASNVSVDAALLDFFTVDQALTPMSAGKININTRQIPVLTSILSGSFRRGDPGLPAAAGSPTPGPVYMGAPAAKTIATQIVTATQTTPLKNKAEMVTSQVFVPATTPPAQPTSDKVDGDATTLYPSIKTQREAPIRALADVANTRTWNLCIDVIAQTGQYSSNATSLSQFQVTGERRYWLHIAIDRYTGAVIDKQLELVL